MSGKPLMTLAIPFYNHIRFVDEAVRSALAQDYPNCEIVLSDDCSTDGTGERIRELVAEYKGPHKVTVNVNDRNLGIGAHMAKIVSLCHGDWVATQGGDDAALPDRLSVTADYARRYPDASAIGVGAMAIDENSCRIEDSHCVSSPVVYEKFTEGRGPMTMSLNPGDNVSFAMIIGAMAAYRRDVLELAPFRTGIGVEDLYLCCRAILLGDIVFATERCVLQRINSSSLTRAMRKGGSRSLRRKKRREMFGRIYSTYQNLLDEAKGYPFQVPNEWLCAIDSRCAEGRLTLLKRGAASLGNASGYAADFRASRMGVGDLWKKAFKLGTHWHVAKALACSVFAKAIKSNTGGQYGAE